MKFLKKVTAANDLKSQVATLLKKNGIVVDQYVQDKIDDFVKGVEKLQKLIDM